MMQDMSMLWFVILLLLVLVAAYILWVREDKKDITKEWENPIWYAVENNQEIGPISLTDMFDLMDERQITHYTLVWRAGMKKWGYACETYEFLDYFDEVPPPLHRPASMPDAFPQSIRRNQHFINRDHHSSNSIAYVATNTFQANTSLVFGILGLFPFLCFLTIPGIILGHIALNKTNRQPKQYGGKKMAKWGMGLSYFSLTVYLVMGVITAVLNGILLRTLDSGL
jgi:hypothetical protein